MTTSQQRTVPPARLPDPWLTVEEIAENMRVSKMSIYRAIHGDYMRHVRVGRSFRVRTSWFEAWVGDGARTHEAAA